MPNRPSLMHPRLMPSLRSTFYVSTVAIDRAVVVQDPESGQELATWSPLAGHTAIPAAVAPAVDASVSMQEVDHMDASWVVRLWQISLNGYYPAIAPEDRCRLDDGRTYDIRGVEADSHQQMTRIKAEEVLP